MEPQQSRLQHNLRRTRPPAVQRAYGTSTRHTCSAGASGEATY